MSDRAEPGGGQVAPIEATSQTLWRHVPREWRDAATEAVVAAGHGDVPMAVVAVITCALWEIDHAD